MRRFLLVLAMALVSALVGRAQDLWLYSVNGDVEVYSLGAWGETKDYQRLQQTDSLRFSEGSSVTILDRRSEQLFAVQKVGSHRVDGLVAEARGRSRRQSHDFITYLWSSLRGNNSVGRYRNAAGVVYRDTDHDAAIAAAVAAAMGSLPVSFELVDPATGGVIGEEVLVGQTAVVKVQNHDAQDLFVNLLDVDSNGVMAVCIPVSSPGQMTQLLIPAGADVVLRSFPIVFVEPRGVDRLILVASPAWFDAEAVVADVQTGRTTSVQAEVGLFQRPVLVK